MDIKPIKYILSIENILSIYRNISFYSNFWRRFICVQITFEIIVTTVTVLIRLYYFDLEGRSEVPFLLNAGNSILAIFLGLCYSKDFKSFIVYLNVSNLGFKSDLEYSKNIKSLRKVVIMGVSIAFLFRLGILIHSVYTKQHDYIHMDFFLYLFFVNVAMGSYRYYVEYILLYCMLNVISEQINCITRSINDTILLRNIRNNQDDVEFHLKLIDKWNNDFVDMRNISKLFNKIFHLQMAVMLGSIIIFYIKYLYSFTSDSINGAVSSSELYNSLIIMLLLMFCLTMVARAAQRVRNSSDGLRRMLAKLCIHSLTNNDYYRATKDLLRLVSTSPIRTQAFGSINVDMALVPKCVLLFTYYTVIGLQFNNVV